MCVKELLEKIQSSYQKIVIGEYDKGTLVRKWDIEPHFPRPDIPEDILGKEVDLITPYYDRISIIVMQKRTTMC